MLYTVGAQDVAFVNSRLLLRTLFVSKVYSAVELEGRTEEVLLKDPSGLFPSEEGDFQRVLLVSGSLERQRLYNLYAHVKEKIND